MITVFLHRVIYINLRANKFVCENYIFGRALEYNTICMYNQYHLHFVKFTLGYFKAKFKQVISQIIQNYFIQMLLVEKLNLYSRKIE